MDRLLAEHKHVEGITILGWRDVPSDPSDLGPMAQAVVPVIVR